MSRENRIGEMNAAGGARVAVVHDWLTGMRGGESVLEGLLELLPGADVFTLIHQPGSVSRRIEERRIVTSWVDSLARRSRDYRRLLPLFPAAVRSLDVTGYDLVVSSSHCVAKGVRVPRNVPHVSYCHTPMRYVWDRFDDYFPRSRPLLRMSAATLAPALRRWDVRSSRGVDSFVANSSFVAERIRRYYGRDSETVHPFVEDRFFDAPLNEAREDYHLVVSALVPYKRIEVAIAAAQIAGRRLIVAGGGPLLDSFRRTAPPGVELRGYVESGQLLDLLARAQSLVLPGIEDFGITPLEAMASGTPVVSVANGGVVDSVLDGETGLLVREGSPPALAAAMLEAERIEWNRPVLRQQAGKFRRDQFLQRMGSLIRRARTTR